MAIIKQNTPRLNRLSDHGAAYRKKLPLIESLGIGVILGIFGNVFVNAIFDLVKSNNGGPFSNDELIVISLISFIICLIPLYYYYSILQSLKNPKGGVTIVASGSQAYRIGDLFEIRGSCITNMESVIIRIFRENQLGAPIFEFPVPIDFDYRYRYPIDTSSLALGQYRIIAFNDNGNSASVSIVVNDM